MYPKDIPVHIKNTFNPGAQGTTIRNQAGDGRPVTGIASIGDIALVTLSAPSMVGLIGIDSRLGERGRGISEGQAQRLGIARALIRNAPILLLDEATSALDIDTEEQVLHNIIRADPGKVIIVSTHRPSVLKLCQRIYMIRDGKIRDSKTFAALSWLMAEKQIKI